MCIALIGVKDHGYFHTALFGFVSNNPVKFAYFPSLVLCSHYIIVKLAKGAAVIRLYVKVRDQVSTPTLNQGYLFWLFGLYLFIQQTSCSGVQTKPS